MMEKDFYLGRILTGRVSSGVVRVGDKISGLRQTETGSSEKIEEAKVCLFIIALYLARVFVKRNVSSKQLQTSF